ncbi:hypothetical protein BH09ACT7_BH09ACT7_54270 [soil metagenome]
MPSTVAALFAAAQVSRFDAVPWRNPVPTNRPGVYLVARTADPARAVVAPVAIDGRAVRRLLEVRPELLVDDQRPSEDVLAQRLGSMWLPDEPVIYAGLAGTSLSVRIGQFYSTRLGARSPHAGGWPVKCLVDLDQAWVHFAECDDVKAAERNMLHAFMKAVSSQSLVAVCDPDLPLPYANLEVIDSAGHRRIKGHRIKGAKARR